ncbi:MAG: TetR/AcrR family transcriptional regulator [Clostridiales bacterium]|nr:TetR/AcrR family transcriptional regulator [Clostridiales bacterium]
MGGALVALLESKEFPEITIMDICKAAGVNRSTFYAHYENTYDLLKETYQGMIGNFLSECTFDDPVDISDMRKLNKDELNFITPKYLLPYLKYIQAHKRLFRIYAENAGAFESNKMDDYMIEKFFRSYLCQARSNRQETHILHAKIFSQRYRRYHKRMGAKRLRRRRFVHLRDHNLLRPTDNL